MTRRALVISILFSIAVVGDTRRVQRRSAATVTPPSFVQADAWGDGTSATTIAVTQTSNPSAGNLIVVFVHGNAAASTSPTVSDGLGNSYTEITAAKAIAGTQTGTAFYKYNAAGGGANAITATYAGATTSRSITVVEYSGVPTGSDPLRAAIGNVQGAPGTGTDILTSTAITTGSGDVLIGYSIDLPGSFSAFVPSSGFASRYNNHPNSTQQRILEDVSLTAGSHAATFSLSDNGGDFYISMAIAFKGN